MGDVVDWLKKAGSAVVRSVKAAGTTVYRAAKHAATSALMWMADEGHQFVDDVKSTWRAIRPHIEMVVAPIAAALERMTVGVPWLHHSVKALNQLLAVVVNLIDGPLGRAIETAIRWTFNLARYIVDHVLGRAHWREAEQHSETLKKASANDAFDPESAHGIKVAAMLLEFHLAIAKVGEALDKGQVEDFNHYLRLRAAQKLLQLSEQRLKAVDASVGARVEVSDDDMFVVAQAHELIKDVPEMSSADLARLDRLIEARLGKNLLPFVFEELLLAWNASAAALDVEWHDAENRRIVTKSELNGLRNRARFGLSDQETRRLDELAALLPDLEMQSGQVLERKDHMQSYVHAAEGFLVFLETPEADLEAEDKAYRAEAISLAAPVIIACAQYGRKWETLTKEDQERIKRLALIYQQSFEQRMLALRT
jgi:hypothetical protein